MRAIALFVTLASAPCASADEIPQIDITRLAAEASGQDWNGDGHADRLLLVWSDKGDAFDALTFISDAATGTLRFTGVSQAILPARWPLDRSDLHAVAYSSNLGCNPGCVADYTLPGLYSKVGDTFIEITVGWTASGWEIAEVQTRAEGSDCVIDYRAGTAKVDWLDDTEYTIDSGPPPALAPYWWREGLPKECRFAPGP